MFNFLIKNKISPTGIFLQETHCSVYFVEIEKKQIDSHMEY